MIPEFEIREERAEDIGAIRELTSQAFGQELEASIIDALRCNKAALLSLVAISSGRVVGHIMYSEASIADKIEGAALGPMAVHPELQRQGIGTTLVGVGNEMMEKAGLPFIIVVGHPDYYPRFGFRPAAERRISCGWEVPDDAFMLLALDEKRMEGVTGVARYRDEFSAA